MQSQFSIRDIGMTPLHCPQCNRWLGAATAYGLVQARCYGCKHTVLFLDGEAAITETDAARRALEGEDSPHPKRMHTRKPQPEQSSPPRIPPSMEEIIATMEERWRLMESQRGKRKAEMAVGIRFDVFHRDGFTCRYCGRSVEQGAILEADHVIPRSAGGPDTLENLVTACWECNSGKSDKRLTA